MRTIPHVRWNVNASKVTVTANGDAENARHEKASKGEKLRLMKTRITLLSTD